ncbi:NAD(P)/FAD-dependent oxidoreductase [Tropicimonas sp. IMCC34043]|uniref:NAD(P)/FAD-dependent oxidoreductase n=1 Tax=Tropicimonas sp. IMCC34043 TaxID=2248760 RepID=UPI000E222252|nr:FAD-dependent oxidoreductase [Tropicimonas sp. IMCC34043]
MPFDQNIRFRPRIAVVGGGISGLSTAFDLSADADVTLFEAEARLGGHARTVMAGRDGAQPVDTGFIVFNFANYPHLTQLFRDLDVPIEKSCMSFGATIDGGRLEYGLQSLKALFAQQRNLGDPRFWAMLRDIARFNARAEQAVLIEDISVGELVDRLKLGAWFRNYYLLPICGAIWSTPADEIHAFPARPLVRFFRNHALMSATGQHQWWTVTGGSREYVRRLETVLRERGAALRTGTPVQAIERRDGQVIVKTANGPEPAFDHIVFATHPDQTLRMLDMPSRGEQAALSAIRYQDNHTFLHRDARQMPRRRDCWSAWVYQADTRQGRKGVGVTYWMNRLQNIPEQDPLFVTLNPARPIAEDLIYDEVVFRHPVFDRAAMAAQDDIAALQGQRNTWFAGAWARHGFHEDGIASARRVTRALTRLYAPRRQVAA